MAARKPAPEIPALTSTLALLQLVAGPEMMAAALPLVGVHLKLTPEKLALLLAKLINPAHVLRESEEQTVRGVSDKTLKSMKDAKEIPAVL